MTLAIWVLAAAVLGMGVITIMSIQRLKASVAGLTTVTTSVLALVSNLAQQIRDNVEDPDALQALADEIDRDSSQLAAAVSNNTIAVEEADAEPLDEDDLDHSGDDMTLSSSDTSGIDHSMGGGGDDESTAGPPDSQSEPVPESEPTQEPTGESDAGQSEGGESGSDQPA